MTFLVVHNPRFRHEINVSNEFLPRQIAEIGTEIAEVWDKYKSEKSNPDETLESLVLLGRRLLLCKKTLTDSFAGNESPNEFLPRQIAEIRTEIAEVWDKYGSEGSNSDEKLESLVLLKKRLLLCNKTLTDSFAGNESPINCRACAGKIKKLAAKILKLTASTKEAKKVAFFKQSTALTQLTAEVCQKQLLK